MIDKKLFRATNYPWLSLLIYYYSFGPLAHKMDGTAAG